MDISSVDIKGHSEMIVTVSAETRSEFSGDRVRSLVLEKLASERNIHGYGIEQLSPPYPVDDKGNEPPPILVGRGPAFPEGTKVTYRQQFRLRRGL